MLGRLHLMMLTMRSSIRSWTVNPIVRSSVQRYEKMVGKIMETMAIPQTTSIVVVALEEARLEVHLATDVASAIVVVTWPDEVEEAELPARVQEVVEQLAL